MEDGSAKSASVSESGLEWESFKQNFKRMSTRHKHTNSEDMSQQSRAKEIKKAKEKALKQQQKGKVSQIKDESLLYFYSELFPALLLILLMLNSS